MDYIQDKQVEALAAGNTAPYKIFKDGDQFVVKNNTGEVKARFKTRDEALKYLRALYVNVPGAAKVADRKAYTGTQKRPNRS